jgi:hypothetical protein
MWSKVSDFYKLRVRDTSLETDSQKKVRNYVVLILMRFMMEFLTIYLIVKTVRTNANSIYHI